MIQSPLSLDHNPWLLNMVAGVFWSFVLSQPSIVDLKQNYNTCNAIFKISVLINRRFLSTEIFVTIFYAYLSKVIEEINE